MYITLETWNTRQHAVDTEIQLPVQDIHDAVVWDQLDLDHSQNSIMK